METIDLTGTWTVCQKGTDDTFAASVPGCVHTDLLEAGRIDNPFYRDNEKDVQWVGQVDWVYARTIDVPASFMDNDRLLLHCEGLDTLAVVRVNGKKVGQSDNMFRTWEFDVSGALKAGENTVEVTFKSTIPLLEKKQRQRQFRGSQAGYRKPEGWPWIRKEACNYGWDWGTTLITCGIWKPMRLLGISTARLVDVHVRQAHTRSKVTLDVTAEVDKLDRSSVTASVTLRQGSDVVAQQAVPVKRGKAEVQFVVKDPKLWWPVNLGEQPLYEVTVEVLDTDEQLLDSEHRRIGLRTIELVREKDKQGESFGFAVNGKPFFAKGANWIPADSFATRVTPDHYLYLLTSASRCNMNMLRVWGGGIYEDDIFYDLCDELGIMVWQDFMFACAAYPAHDDEFMTSVKHEAEDQVRRLRHHPCMALWCGNNELEQIGFASDREDLHGVMTWDEYKALFDHLLDGVATSLDPEVPYWPSSPHTPVGDRTDAVAPESGDSHLWAVWHGKQPFEWYRTTTHRFCSEFGFQSFPEPKTVHDYTAPEDRNITHPIMEHHQRSPIGNGTILTYMLEWFRLPTSFDMLLWASQIQHGMAMKYAVEHWRRMMPHTMGALYWQLNDCWPVASWASIDYHGRWKALQYMARHFFAPLMVSGIEMPEKKCVEVHVTSDLLEKKTGSVAWRVTTVDGTELKSGSTGVKLTPCKSKKVTRIDLKPEMITHGEDNLMVWLELKLGGKVVSTNFVSFARPKRMALPDPEFKTTVKSNRDGSYAVTLESKAPALWTWLELKGVDAQYDDNFVHVVPGRPVTITVIPDRKINKTQFTKKLMVRSLVDTYR
ncbi:MAG: beta-mannosidase [Planctomycetota bacterium]